MIAIAIGLAVLALVVATCTAWYVYRSDPRVESRALRAGQAAFEVSQREAIHAIRNRIVDVEPRLYVIEEHLGLLLPPESNGSGSTRQGPTPKS